MKKTKLLSLTIAGLLMILASTFVSNAFANYPGPDLEEDKNEDLWNGVVVQAGGWYLENYYWWYMDDYHHVQRWATGFTECSGPLYVYFASDTYSIPPAEVYDDQAGGTGYNVWDTFVYTFGASYFHNWLTDDYWYREKTIDSTAAY